MFLTKEVNKMQMQDKVRIRYHLAEIPYFDINNITKDVRFSELKPTILAVLENGGLKVNTNVK